MGRAGCCYVPAASISITMLSACVWLANDLYTSAVAKYIFYIKLVEESSSARELQKLPAIG